MRFKQAMIYALVVLLTVTTIGGVVVFANDDIQNIQSEIDDVNSKIKDIEADKKEKNQYKNKIVGEIKTTETSIAKLESNIAGLNVEIEQTEAAVATTTTELLQAEQNIAVYEELLGKRLRAMYKTGQVGYLEVLLRAKDFTDLLNRVDMVQKIYQHDTDLVNFMVGQRNKVEENKDSLEHLQAKLEGDLEQVVESKRELKYQVAIMEDQRNEISLDIKALEEQEDELKSDADRLKEVLKNLQMKTKYVGGKMVWPTPGYYRITSPFGNRIHPIYKTPKLHTGIDIAISKNKPIVAAQGGIVIYSGWYGGYGKVVMVDHGGGIVTLYAHNNSLKVTVGTSVKAGDTLALSGSTGNSTGPNLHFEVRKDGEYVDPTKYVTAN